MYLVDTDWIVDYLNGRPAARRLLDSASIRGAAISLVTYGEIYDGILHGANAEAHEVGFQHMLRWIDVLSFNEAIMYIFARIRGDLRNIGQSIGDLDLMIAATALHHDLTLVTRNLKHFERVPDLKLLIEST